MTLKKNKLSDQKEFFKNLSHEKDKTTENV